MTHRFSAGRLLVSLSLALSFAALDSRRSIATESGASSIGTAVDACALLSANEISVIVHFNVEDGVRNDSGPIQSGPYDGAYSTTCLWKASEDTSMNDPRLPLGGARFVILNVMAWPSGSQYAGRFLQGFRDAANDHTIPNTPVTLMIGDESLWWGDGVAVRKGHISYGVSVHSVSLRAKERQMGEALAAKIVERL